MKRALGIISCLSLVFVLTACGPAMPDLTGMTRSDAETAIKAAGMSLGEVSFYESSIAASGTVVAQDPEAGARATAGMRVGLTLSGSAPVAAPAVGGLDATAAIAAIEAAGLKAEVVESYSTTAPAGTLISQSLEPGTSAARGSEVKVVVSKGPEPGHVPDVMRKTETEARSALVAAGYKVVAVTRVADAATGTVIAQTPTGGTVKTGGSVTITVSSGAGPVQVNLRGTWRGSDGSSYEFRAGSRVAVPGGGVVRYRLAGNGILFFYPARAVSASIAWASADQFTLKIVKNAVLGPAIIYKRVK